MLRQAKFTGRKAALNASPEIITELAAIKSIAANKAAFVAASTILRALYLPLKMDLKYAVFKI